MSRTRLPKRSDLRAVARVAVPRRALGELLVEARREAEDVQLWLAEPWPWTPGTEGAFYRLRPRWAVAALAIADVHGLDPFDAEASVRELNRAHDPWPSESKQMVPVPRPATHTDEE